MAQYRLVGLSNPVPGREREFGRWYDERHLPGIRAVDRIVSTERYAASLEDFGTPGWAYLTPYEIETDDAARVLAEMYAVAGGVDTYSTEAVD